MLTVFCSIEYRYSVIANERIKYRKTIVQKVNDVVIAILTPAVEPIYR